MQGDVQRLRDVTGAGVMDCKHALDDARGDFDKALEFIRERGIAKAQSKKGRATGAGLLETYVHNGRIGVILEIRAETDFVVRSEPFQELARALAMHIAAMNPSNIEELFMQPYVRDETITIKDLIERVFTQVGENIKVERFCRYEV